MIIRHAKPTDLAHVVQLCVEHAAEEQLFYHPENKAEQLALFLFDESPRLKCVVAEMEGRIVGYATFMKEFSTWDADFYVNLDCLFIQPKWRGRSIGLAVIRQVALFALIEGCQVIQWQTSYVNQRAVRFFHRLGAVSKRKFKMCLHKEAQVELVKNTSPFQSRGVL